LYVLLHPAAKAASATPIIIFFILVSPCFLFSQAAPPGTAQ